MRYTENQCVNCGLPCVSACRYKKVEVCRCDRCNGEADLYADGEDLCIDCFNDYLEEIFHEELSMQDRAKILGVKYELL